MGPLKARTPLFVDKGRLPKIAPVTQDRLLWLTLCLHLSDYGVWALLLPSRWRLHVR